MNLKKFVLLAATVTGGLLSANALSAAASIHSIADDAQFSAPAPVKIVAPTNVPRRYQNETIRISLMVDAEGRAHDVALVRGRDAALAQRLLPAVAQWQFKPAMKNGRPVATRVVLPLELVEQRQL